MAVKLRKSTVLPIGIDLGTGAIKLAQLRRTDQELELLAAAQVDVPAACRDDAEKRAAFAQETVRGILKAKGFSGRQCILSLPAAATFVQHVKMPKLPPADLEKALRWELEGKLPFSLGEAEVRHIVAGEVYGDREPNLEVIVIAASRQAVDQCLDMARHCGLDVVGLNVEACAIVECFARLFRRAEDARRAALFLDLGLAYTRVVIAHGARLVFARNLATGARNLEGAAAVALQRPVEQVHAARRQAAASDSSPDAERLYEAMREAIGTLATDVTKCLRYYESVFPSQPVERAVFLGGQACDRRLCQALAQHLNLPAQIGDPLARVTRPPAVADVLSDGQQAQPAWAVAVGLSLGWEIAPAA